MVLQTNMIKNKKNEEMEGNEWVASKEYDIEKAILALTPATMNKIKHRTLRSIDISMRSMLGLRCACVCVCVVAYMASCSTVRPQNVCRFIQHYALNVFNCVPSIYSKPKALNNLFSIILNIDY